MKKLLLVCIASMLSAHFAVAKTVHQINVVGNSRIETETILFEIPYKKGEVYEDNIADKILKALNRTGYFDDVKVDVAGDVVTIHVKENPVINKIAYEGMKSSIRETMRDLVKLKTRQVLTKSSIQETQQILLEIYRRQGYLSAKVTPKIVRLPQNRADVVFEIKEGKVAYVRKIVFIGNKAFPAGLLKDVIGTREKEWFHLAFLGGTANKVYDPERFVQDQQDLIRFYMGQGYADFDIVSASAELSTDKENFFLTFYIREGEKYKFGDISVESKIKKVDETKLKNSILARKGQVFNNQMVEFCEEFLKSVAKMQGYNFAVVDSVFQKDPKTRTVDVKFVVRDGPKVFIDRIDIKGNRHTRDEVIRRDVGFDEGDPFYAKNLKAAEESLKRLNYFKTVKVDASEGTRPNSAIVTVDVEEQRTGEVFAQAGYSSLDRATIRAHLLEPNFRGKAQTLALDVSYSKKELSCSLDFSEPRFCRRPLLGEFSLFHLRSKRMIGSIRTETGGLVSTGYHLTRHAVQNWTYKLHREKLEENSKLLGKIDKYKKDNSTTDDNAWETWLKSDAGKDHLRFISMDDEYGVYWGSSIIHTIAYDRRNRSMLPSKGYRVSWTTKITGLGGSIHNLTNTWSASVHQRIYKEIIFNIRGTFSHIMGLGAKPLRIADALYLGGETLRGFDFQGISPVRWIPKNQYSQVVSQFIENEGKNEKNSSDDRKFLKDNKEKIHKTLTEGDRSGVSDDDQTKISNIFTEALKDHRVEASKLSTFQSLRGRKIGSTLIWYGTTELVFPMPLLPRDSEVFGTVFTDFGSAWRSNRSQEEGDILHDCHTLRVASGLSIAWNSPFGLLSIGYAWPLKKTPYDLQQRFLFGYGMKFS